MRAITPVKTSLTTRLSVSSDWENLNEKYIWQNVVRCLYLWDEPKGKRLTWLYHWTAINLKHHPLQLSCRRNNLDFRQQGITWIIWTINDLLGRQGIHVIKFQLTLTTWFYTHGPLTRYVKLRVVHAPGIPGKFSPSSRVSNTDMHHGTCVTHVPWCIAGIAN